MKKGIKKRLNAIIKILNEDEIGRTLADLECIFSLPSAYLLGDHFDNLKVLFHNYSVLLYSHRA